MRLILNWVWLPLFPPTSSFTCFSFSPPFSLSLVAHAANDNAHLRALYGLPTTPVKEELLLNVNMLLPGGMAVSLVDSTRGRPEEFALFSTGGITASLTQTTQRWKAAAGVQDLQLDFQHHDALFPCVVYRRKQVRCGATEVDALCCGDRGW